MIVTKEWLETYSSGENGWCANQLKVIGVQWPPGKGWKKAIIGTDISTESAGKFELYAGTSKVKGDNMVVRYKNLTKRVSALTDELSSLKTKFAALEHAVNLVLTIQDNNQADDIDCDRKILLDQPGQPE